MFIRDEIFSFEYMYVSCSASQLNINRQIYKVGKTASSTNSLEKRNIEKRKSN